MSGMFTDNRKEYLAMIESVARGEIDVIVVLKLDRLGRDAGKMIEVLNMFNRLRMRIHRRRRYCRQHGRRRVASQFAIDPESISRSCICQPYHTRRVLQR